MGWPRKAKENNSKSGNPTYKKRPPRSATKKDSPIENETTIKLKSSLPNVSIFDYLNTMTYDTHSKKEMKAFTKVCILKQFNELNECKVIVPFERRVTSLQWHPKYSKIFATGSKGGELLCLNLTSGTSIFIPGIGPGGSVVGLKFSVDDMYTIYTVSITGNLRKESLHNKTGKTLLSTGSFQNWFTSLDISEEKKLLLAGDCKGKGFLLNIKDGQKHSLLNLHKDKVNHIEFCSLDCNMFVTASLDHSVKLWDLRMLSKSGLGPEPVCTLPHLKGVNSAYFSPTNKNSLLTTDQHSEIRVYKSPWWTEQLVIKHPHRQFQHITPIKAIWHPLEDIIVVGRYPDEAFQPCDPRTVDFFDGTTGDILQRNTSVTGGIVSLNAFNNSGECLASASGRGIAFKASTDMFKNFPPAIKPVS